MRLLKLSVGVCLAIHVVVALLLVGRYPALFRAATLAWSDSPATEQGMSLAVYRHGEPSGTGWRHSVPGALVQLDIPSTSLEAFAVWSVPKGGTYTLVFECGERGAVFVDGHRVIGVLDRSANYIGVAPCRSIRGPTSWWST